MLVQFWPLKGSAGHIKDLVRLTTVLLIPSILTIRMQVTPEQNVDALSLIALELSLLTT